MKINDAELIISAVKPEQYPKDGLSEIAFFGRSNVGKSSFINKVLGRKKLARTSSSPGKTRTINFYKIDNSFYFVDFPGFGYAKVSKTERQKFRKMMADYLNTRQNLKLAVLLVDFRHKPTENDILVWEYLGELGIPLMLIASKTDKVKVSLFDHNLKQIMNEMQMDFPFDFLNFSSTNGLGKDDFLQYINNII